MITRLRVLTCLKRGEGQQSWVTEGAPSLHQSINVGKGMGREGTGVSSQPLPPCILEVRECGQKG